MAQEYDLVIIGGGIGGYSAAIRASQLGMKTALVEKERLGGTCLHQGCIPSKALLQSAAVFRQAKDAAAYGVETGTPSVNYLKVQERKNRIVNQLHQGVEGLIRKGNIEIFAGFGRILGPSIFSPSAGTVSVELNNGEENSMLIPNHLLLATGSVPKTVPGLEPDGCCIFHSDSALEMEQLPESMLIVGGGVIGIEWASMLADFEVEVTVLEYADTILPEEDRELSGEMKRLLKQKQIRIVTGARIRTETLRKDKTVQVEVEYGEELETFEAEKMLVSAGRKANTGNLGLSNTDIKCGVHGEIETNSYFQTKEAHIYAAGDVTGNLQLAHVAAREGIIAVEHMAGLQPEPLDYRRVPKAVYSHPEAASIGLTEQQARTEGFQIKTGKMPFKAAGKAWIRGETEGFVKVIMNKENNDLLGVHIIGSQATEMIAEASLAAVLDATPWEIAAGFHPHPSLSEVLGEAALAVDGKNIHG